MQSGPGSTSRIASAFAGSSFIFTVNITDGQIHQVSLYLLDFDDSSRTETITIFDPVSGAVLDTESYTALSGGEYVSWNIGGNVVIQITQTGANHAVVSGIFFGPAPLGSTGPPPPVSNIPGSAIYAPASGSAGNVAGFTTDYYFSGGGTDNFQSSSQPPAVDTSETSTDGYQSVYQNDRYGNFSYILPNLTPGEYYTLNLHFAEIQFTSAAQRQFNVSINNTPYLHNFDIVAEAGAANRAIVKSYRVTPDATGKIAVSFTPGAASIPKLSGLELFAPLTVSSNTPSASALVVSQIAAGSSAAVGSFSADAAYTGGTTATYSSGPAIDLSGVNNPAPSAVYQAERSGSSFSYALANLAAGQVYTVRLHFAENAFSAPGQRQFNVSINNAQVLTNFDIFAAAGAASRAIVRAFAAVPNSSGQIVISFSSGAAGSAKVSGIELVAGVRISASGAGASYWEADQYYNGGGLFSQSGVSIDTSEVTNPAPAPVYENSRYGYTTYTIPNLSPNTAYQLNLHFAETTFPAAGDRQFNVDVNGTRMLTNFDIFAAAGAANRAVIAPLSVTANSAGQIIVHLTPGAAQAPSISGLELVQAGSSGNGNPAGTYQITGRVLLGGSGPLANSGLRNFIVTLNNGQSTTTAADGSYSFTVSAGTYIITASYPSLAAVCTLSAPQTVSVTGASASYPNNNFTSTFTVTGGQTTAFTEVPSANTYYSDTVLFSGWALDTATPISSVALAIDGATLGNAYYGGTRQDVCSAVGNDPGCPYVGWSMPVDLASLAGGAHTLTVTATTLDGRSSSTSTTFDVPDVQTLVAIDLPSTDTSTSYLGAQSFSGWALDPLNTISSVSIAIDGFSFGNASYGTPARPDVCGILGNDPGCPNVGWSIPVDLALLSSGPHTLIVTATTSDGQQASVGRTFNVNAASTTMFLEVPSAGGTYTGALAADGWAYDNAYPISSIAVALDGVPQGNAVYGAIRTDVCSAGAQPGCPNVGWYLATPIDTSALASGNHSLTVTATTSDGRTTSLPARTFNVQPAQTVQNVEVPSANSTVANSAAFDGWAYDSGYPIASVAVIVDGASAGNATYGYSRTDVCNAGQHPGCPNVGWSFNASAITPGAHTFSATITTTDGRSLTTSPFTFFVTGPDSTATPSKEYIYLNGKPIAIENHP